MESKKDIRPSVVAGQFYPKKKEELEKMINDFLLKAKVRNYPKVTGLIVPHAGYIYSGPVAAEAFKQINQDIKEVIILAPTHHIRFQGASIGKFEYYSTPLGKVELSDKVENLLKEEIFVSVPDTHKREHSIEVEIPFLQEVLGDFKIIPIITGSVDPKKLADTLMNYVNEGTLIVVSSDLSHYHSYESAVELDRSCINNIINFDFDELEEREACGKVPILTLMYLADKLDWEGKLVDYRNSGDTAGNNNRVVGYTSIVFYRPPLKREDQEFLLNLSRKTIDNYLKNGSKPKLNRREISQELKKPSGCFVTLFKEGQLRGCVGCIFSEKELYQSIIENTINAAFKDARFPPVTEDEIDDIKIEISILSDPKELSFKDSEELLSKLTPIKDGVLLENGPRSATYLPQVWKQLPDKEEFLCRLCMKAGLPPESWKENDTKIKIYRDFAFCE
ncbi:MAG: AmmeMemoRadiSam system protein B [Candidatus Aenigmarchaeota archaeon]|nr:AmmeMemoRadiSam system protein B [Candidatus Aenigmarchaeota archaeon]